MINGFPSILGNFFNISKTGEGRLISFEPDLLTGRLKCHLLSIPTSC
jgi:hypothetical protein